MKFYIEVELLHTILPGKLSHKDIKVGALKAPPCYHRWQRLGGSNFNASTSTSIQLTKHNAWGSRPMATSRMHYIILLVLPVASRLRSRMISILASKSDWFREATHQQTSQTHSLSTMPPSISREVNNGNTHPERPLIGSDYKPADYRLHLKGHAREMLF